MKKPTKLRPTMFSGKRTKTVYSIAYKKRPLLNMRFSTLEAAEYMLSYFMCGDYTVVALSSHTVGTLED